MTYLGIPQGSMATVSTTTYGCSGYLQKVGDRNDEEQSFKRLVALKGLKIIDAVETSGGIEFICKRGNKKYIIKTNGNFIEVLNSKKENIFEMGWRFIQNTFVPNWTTETYSDKTGYATDNTTNITDYTYTKSGGNWLTNACTSN
jgi:hypothetical protein